MSKLVIQLKNGENVMFLIYDGHTENLESNSIFGHPIWNKINGNNRVISRLVLYILGLLTKATNRDSIWSYGNYHYI